MDRDVRVQCIREGFCLNHNVNRDRNSIKSPIYRSSHGKVFNYLFFVCIIYRIVALHTMFLLCIRSFETSVLNTLYHQKKSRLKSRLSNSNYNQEIMLFEHERSARSHELEDDNALLSSDQVTTAWIESTRPSDEASLNSDCITIFCKSQRITKTRLFKYIETFTFENRKLSDKNLWYFSYFCSKYRLWVLFRNRPHRGGSNEYPQSMFLSRNKKNNVYPCKPQFYSIKVGLMGVKII